MSTVRRAEVARKVKEYKRVVPLDAHERAVLEKFTLEEQLGTLAVMYRIDRRMSRRAIA